MFLPSFIFCKSLNAPSERQGAASSQPQLSRDLSRQRCPKLTKVAASACPPAHARREGFGHVASERTGGGDVQRGQRALSGVLGLKKMDWRDPMLPGSDGLVIQSQRNKWKMCIRTPAKQQYTLTVPWPAPFRVRLAECCKLQRKPRMTNNCRNLENQVPLDFMGSAILNTLTCLSEGKWAINSSLVVIKRM